LSTYDALFWQPRACTVLSLCCGPVVEAGRVVAGSVERTTSVVASVVEDGVVEVGTAVAVVDSGGLDPPTVVAWFTTPGVVLTVVLAVKVVSAAGVVSATALGVALVVVFGEDSGAVVTVLIEVSVVTGASNVVVSPAMFDVVMFAVSGVVTVTAPTPVVGVVAFGLATVAAAVVESVQPIPSDMAISEVVSPLRHTSSSRSHPHTPRQSQMHVMAVH
jgi:hypothetical protein